MAIKLADIIENYDITYPVINAGQDPTGLYGTFSPIAGFGIFKDIDGRDSLPATRQTTNYLSVVGSNAFIFDTGGTWTTESSHTALLTDANYDFYFRISDFPALTIPAGETAGTFLTTQYDTALLLIEPDPVEKPEKITISQLFEAFAVTVITENVDNGAGSFASYGGTVASGGNPADIDGDGIIGISDVLMVLSTFGLTSSGGGKGHRVVEQDLSNHPSYSVVDWTPTGNSTGANVPLVATAPGVTISQIDSNDATVAVSISTSTGYHTFSDGPEYEIAVGAGTSGAKQFGFAWPDMTFQEVTGGSLSQLYFYLTVGRKVNNTWTDYTGMIAAFQVGIDGGDGGSVPDQTGNFILATNMANFPYMVIPPGPAVTIEGVGANNLPTASFIPSTGASSGQQYSLYQFWESLSAAAGDNLLFWVANMQEVRAKFHYTQAGGSNYYITFTHPWKFSCKP